MNAELGAMGLAKIIVPTVFRENYMGSLKKFTKQRDNDAYIRMLLRAWEFSAIYTKLIWIKWKNILLVVMPSFLIKMENSNSSKVDFL